MLMLMMMKGAKKLEQSRPQPHVCIFRVYEWWLCVALLESVSFIICVCSSFLLRPRVHGISFWFAALDAIHFSLSFPLSTFDKYVLWLFALLFLLVVVVSMFACVCVWEGDPFTEAIIIGNEPYFFRRFSIRFHVRLSFFLSFVILLRSSHTHTSSFWADLQFFPKYVCECDLRLPCELFELQAICIVRIVYFFSSFSLARPFVLLHYYTFFSYDLFRLWVRFSHVYVCEPNDETNQMKNNALTGRERERKEFEINQQSFRFIAKSHLSVDIPYMDCVYWSAASGKEQENVSHCTIHLKRTTKKMTEKILKKPRIQLIILIGLRSRVHSHIFYRYFGIEWPKGVRNLYRCLDLIETQFGLNGWVDCPTTMRLVLESANFYWYKSFYRVWGPSCFWNIFRISLWKICRMPMDFKCSETTQKREVNLNGCANLCNCQGLHKTPNDGHKFNNLWLIHGITGLCVLHFLHH